MAEERIYLPSPGSIPGIPGSHGAGDYLVDWDARTVRAFEEAQPEQETGEQPAPVAEEVAPVQEAPAEQPVVPDVAEELTHLEEELHTLEASQEAPQA